MEKDYSGFTKEEMLLIKKLSNPYKVQEFVETLEYNQGGRLCPQEVLRQRKADCLEAALLSIMILRYHKIECFLTDLESVRDEDHELCIYKSDGRYGSIAQSKFLGLKFRYPAYSSVRELVMSYFEHYFNFFGELTLRAYSVPVLLDKHSRWYYDNKEIEEIDKTLYTIKHYELIPKSKRFPTVSTARFEKEILILPKWARIGKKYRKLQKQII